MKLAECIIEAGLLAGVFNLVTGRGSVVGTRGVEPRHTGGGFYRVGGDREHGGTEGRRESPPAGDGGKRADGDPDDADLDTAVEAASPRLSSAPAELHCWRAPPGPEGRPRRLLEEAHRRDGSRDTPRGSFASETTLGPLNNEPTAQKMDLHVTDALEWGAGSCGRRARADGFPTRLYYPPTVLDRVDDGMRVAREETFGPVAPVSTVRDETEALQTVGSSPYGLLLCRLDAGPGARPALRRVPSGTGWVNINASTNHWESHLPFGGRAGSRSGMGRVGGRHPMEIFTELKTVVLSLE